MYENDTTVQSLELHIKHRATINTLLAPISNLNNCVQIAVNNQDFKLGSPSGRIKAPCVTSECLSVPCISCSFLDPFHSPAILSIRSWQPYFL